MNNSIITYIQQISQQYLTEPMEIFRQYIMYPATIQHKKLMHHHVSVWESLSNVETFFLVFSIFCWVVMMGFSILGLFVARKRYAAPRKSVSSKYTVKNAPGVTIIRPLKGVDCNLYNNLQSSFRQDYPVFEILLSVASEKDPAIKVVKELMERYPEVDARLIIAKRDVGVNPKINNMITSYESAKYDIIWILDSNIFVEPGCLARSVEKLSLPGVGLVHHLPFAVRPATFGSELEMMFLDTVHAKMYLAINLLGPDSCVVGKSNLYRKSDIESIGGLAQFGQYIAEDNLLARALWRKGFKHEMTTDLAYQPLGSMETADYFLRRSRWTRIRKYTVTAATVVEPLTESVICGLIASYGFSLLWQIHPLNFFAFHIITWFMLDLSLFQALSGKKIEVEELRGFIMAWALREITALPLYVYSVIGNTVDWRDGTFRLMTNSTVVKIQLPPPTNRSHKRSLSFPSLRLSTRPVDSRNFSLNPWVVASITSVILVIDIVMDVLFKSERNGKSRETDSNSLSLKPIDKEGSRRRRRKAMRGASDGSPGDEKSGNEDSSADERDMKNRSDPIIRAA
ncbi:1360_t:CDS:2, partial [Ambispora leptoticha]